MKAIIKSNEPASLIEHRASQHASYENLDKTDLRASLLVEQGHICCYCMRRIPESNKNPGCKIEHFLSQEHHSQHALDYSNMLLACLGQEGSPKHLQTCDTYKGDSDLSLSPSNPSRNIEDLIKYKSNGEIYSDDETLNSELESVLNLNVKILKDNRRVLYEEVQKRIQIEGKRQRSKKLKKKFLEDEKSKLLNLSSDKHTEFCMVGVYVINKKLKRIA